MLVGAASRELRFQPGIPMAGFAARTVPSSGTHDPLSARALTVSTEEAATLIVVADLTSVSPEQATAVRRRVAAATGVPEDAITVAVTHTHAAPNIDPWMTTPTASPQVWEDVAATLVEVAVAAWERRRSATMMAGVGTAALTVNRRRHDGPRDDTLHVLRFVDPSGHTVAVVFNYACHPTVIGPENSLLSADWPGAARTRVEEAFPAAVALYLQGFCGDCNTGHSAHSSMDPSAQGGRTPQRAEALGRAFGDEVVRIAREARVSRGDVAHGFAEREWVWTATDAVSPEFSRPSAAQSILLPLSRVWSERLQSMASPVREAMRVTCFRWSDVVVVHVVGEPFAELGRELRALLPDTRVITVGYANGVPGYLPYPMSERSLGGYEVDEAHIVYGRPRAIPHEVAEDAKQFALDFARHSALPEK